MSRDKGKAGEREITRELVRRGIEHVREQDGRTQGADFLIQRTFALDAKRQETLLLPRWHREVEGRTPSHLVPVVAWRRSREPWRVSLLLSDFLDLIEGAGQ